MCVIVSLWSLCDIFVFITQYGGAIYNYSSGDLTFEGSATFTSCSAEASGSSSELNANANAVARVDAENEESKSSLSELRRRSKAATRL